MQIKALIIEDEAAAARRLEKLIHAVDPNIQIIARLDSIQSSVRWLEQNPPPDLLFLDIHLGDGLSFAIFEKVQPHCPIIFTTAYDEFAIKAFKLNSIDYLLKPIKEEELRQSIIKLRHLYLRSGNALPDLSKLLERYHKPAEQFKKRFIVNFGDKIKAIETHDIAYFMIMEKSTFLITRNNESFGISYSLEQLENLLDPSSFFRINRKYIIAFSSIEQMWTWTRSRVKLKLAPLPSEDIIVSTDRSSPFKEWLNQ
ncbi:MAG: LytR/AlgR family response regulator transcription factor [Bacteroidales bacterium]